MNKKFTLLLVLFLCAGATTSLQAQHSVARQWNEALLDAIRVDVGRPTVHARNLFHTSVAMYDAWAAYDQVADTYFLGKTVDGFTCSFDGISIPPIPRSWLLSGTRRSAMPPTGCCLTAFKILRARQRPWPVSTT